MSIPFDALAVTIEGGQAPALLWSAQSQSDLVAWQFEDLSGWFPGHVAALAVAAAP